MFSSHHYFFKATLTSLFIMWAMVYLIMGNAFWDLLSLKKDGALLPIFVGIITALVMALIADKNQENFATQKRASFVIPPLIFVTALFMGSLTNFLYQANWTHSITNEFMDWFVKPTYWLFLLGLPLSLVLGFSFRRLAR